ncbi:MAG: sugar phosphate isomerase/epimerase [Deltaproteobacteria bacterium]|nr:sugar phosphate isomerase/epimerase [Deltaproteobacteria bacterium]
MKTKINFGIHLGFAINRYPEPEEWARLVAEELGLHEVQFVSDLLQPHFPDDVIDRQVDLVLKALQKYKIKTTHTFTSPRWNYFANPDAGQRDYWLWWFKRYASISQRLGAKSTGCLLGVYSVRDYAERRDYIFNEVIRGWHELAAHARQIGLECVTWEPMSIPREMGETIQETKKIMAALNQNTKPAVPILICLDVDHGDVSSADPDDIDPYAWIKNFGKQIPLIHLKQRTKDLFGHKPFTPQHNENGIIFPERIIKAIEDSGATETTIYLELSFRERQPYENNVIKDLKASVEYWRPFMQERGA